MEFYTAQSDRNTAVIFEIFGKIALSR